MVLNKFKDVPQVVRPMLIEARAEIDGKSLLIRSPEFNIAVS